MSFKKNATSILKNLYVFRHMQMAKSALVAISYSWPSFHWLDSSFFLMEFISFVQRNPASNMKDKKKLVVLNWIFREIIKKILEGTRHHQENRLECVYWQEKMLHSSLQDFKFQKEFCCRKEAFKIVNRIICVTVSKTESTLLLTFECAQKQPFFQICYLPFEWINKRRFTRSCI